MDDNPKSVTLTDANMAALFAAKYGEAEGRKRLEDTRQHGAAAALRMAEQRATKPEKGKRNG